MKNINADPSSFIYNSKNEFYILFLCKYLVHKLLKMKHLVNNSQEKKMKKKILIDFIPSMLPEAYIYRSYFQSKKNIKKTLKRLQPFPNK
jgi:hypothetical protein